MRQEVLKVLKKAGAGAVCMLLMLGLTVTAYGAAGSVFVSLKDLKTAGSSREGVEIQMYQVGEAGENQTPVFYARYGIEEYPQDSKALDEAAKKIAASAAGNSVRTAKTDAQGTAGFEDVENGIYLIEVTEDNSYGVVAPFLVHLPYYEMVNGGLEGPIYQVNAEPKASPLEPDVTKPETPKPETPKPQKPKPETQKPGKPQSPAKTGDEGNPAAYGALAVLAVLGTWYAGRRRRKDA